MVDKALVEYLESFLTEKRRERFKNILAHRTNHFTVATEDVYQLHNTSAVMRSCEIFGLQNLHVIEEINTKNIDREIAMGAQKWVDLNRHHSVEKCISQLKSQGYRIIATTPHNNSSLLEDFNVTKKACFFFGRETEGLSDIVLKQADEFLKIPMYGFTESLNISVSASIILQEATRKLRNSKEIKWKLTEKEQWQKRMDWCKQTLKNHELLIGRYNSELR